MSRSAAFRHKFYTYLDDAVQRVLEEQWLPQDSNDGFYYALLQKP